MAAGPSVHHTSRDRVGPRKRHRVTPRHLGRAGDPVAAAGRPVVGVERHPRDLRLHRRPRVHADDGRLLDDDRRRSVRRAAAARGQPARRRTRRRARLHRGDDSSRRLRHARRFTARDRARRGHHRRNRVEHAAPTAALAGRRSHRGPRWRLRRVPRLRPAGVRRGGVLGPRTGLSRPRPARGDARRDERRCQSGGVVAGDPQPPAPELGGRHLPVPVPHRCARARHRPRPGQHSGVRRRLSSAADLRSSRGGRPGLSRGLGAEPVPDPRRCGARGGSAVDGVCVADRPWLPPGPTRHPDHAAGVGGGGPGLVPRAASDPSGSPARRPLPAAALDQRHAGGRRHCRDLRRQREQCHGRPGPPAGPRARA